MVSKIRKKWEKVETTAYLTLFIRVCLFPCGLKNESLPRYPLLSRADEGFVVKVVVVVQASRSSTRFNACNTATEFRVTERGERVGENRAQKRLGLAFGNRREEVGLFLPGIALAWRIRRVAFKVDAYPA